MVEVREKMDEPRSKSRGDLWQLSGDWIAKIEKAYQQYVDQKSAATKSATLYMIAFVSIFFGFVLVTELASRSRESEFLGRLEVRWAFGMTLVMLTCIAGLEFFRRFQLLRTSREELEDLLHISEELLQMLISSEERRSGGKYEYLINHVRILEVRHLLKKIERVVHIKIPFLS
jgi:hypothetical protein